jgi:hypothetical protein
MVLYCVAQRAIRLQEPARPIRVVGTQGSTHAVGTEHARPVLTGSLSFRGAARSGTAGARQKWQLLVTCQHFVFRLW